MKKVIGIILASLASILLVCTLTISPIIYGVGAFITEETIISVLQDMDYGQILGTEVNLQEEIGFSEEDVNAIMSTDAAQEIISLYVQDLFLPINGSYKTGTLTEEKIREILKEHVEELNPYTIKFFEYYGAGSELEGIDVSEYTVELFATYLTLLPTADDLGLTDANTLASIQIFKSGMVVIPFVVVAAILSIIVFVCRLANLKGMLWLAIDYVLAGLACFGVANAIKSVPSADATLTSFAPALAVFANSIQIGSLIVLGLAVVFGAGYFIIKKVKSNKQAEVTM